MPEFVKTAFEAGVVDKEIVDRVTDRKDIRRLLCSQGSAEYSGPVTGVLTTSTVYGRVNVKVLSLKMTRAQMVRSADAWVFGRKYECARYRVNAKVVYSVDPDVYDFDPIWSEGRGTISNLATAGGWILQHAHLIDQPYRTSFTGTTEGIPARCEVLCCKCVY
jgi:hypothetical protein